MSEAWLSEALVSEAWLSEASLSEGFGALVRARRMCRAFRSDPIPPEVIDGLIDLARRAPSAGHSQPWDFLVLEGATTARYWDATLPLTRRANFPWPGLLDAPVLLVPCVRPQTYPERYNEADKAGRVAASPAARAGLAQGVEGWPVPYWFVDGGMAAMTLLLGAHDVGLGALFFGLFEQEQVVRRVFGIPADRVPLGTIALGWPLPADQQRPAASAARRRAPLAEIIHRGTW